MDEQTCIDFLEEYFERNLNYYLPLNAINVLVVKILAVISVIRKE